jgi:hypothetical protein
MKAYAWHDDENGGPLVIELCGKLGDGVRKAA